MHACMMGCGGRSSRIIFSGLTLRRCNPKIVAYSNPIQEFVPRRTFSWRSNLGQATILRSNGVKNQQRESPFVDGAKRFYNWGSVDDNPLKGWKRWVWNIETSVILSLFGLIVALDIYLGSWVTVPYTNRRQLLLSRPSLDKDAAQKFDNLKKNLAWIILPPPHPDNVRVQTIAGNLIEASRRKGGDDARIKKTWEVLVINDPAHAVVSSHHGKIAIFGGILHSCGDDAEIAAYIAPAVGGVVANHKVENYIMLQLLLYLIFLILHVWVSSKPSSLLHFFRFPLVRSLFYCMTLKPVAFVIIINKIYSFMLHLEADYIGLMLLASAGYDPRVALQTREKMSRMKGGGSWWEKMRARRLVLDMEEALSIYGEVMPEQAEHV